MLIVKLILTRDMKMYILLINLLYEEQNLDQIVNVFQHYDNKVIADPKAKTTYLEPDLLPFT